MSQSRESKNKALVLKTFDTLFNQRDYVAAERFWSSNYIQHSAHIEPGREGNGRPRSWIAADVVRIADEVLAEHWDVLQDEATRAESKSGLPMFGDSFAE